MGRKQKAGQQQQARCDWLLAQQCLEQEAADCEAALAGWVEAGLEPGMRSQASARLGEPGSEAGAVGNVSQATQDSASSSIAEAVALAQAVASVLAAHGPPARRTHPGQLAGLKSRLQAAEQAMQQQLVALQAAASELLGQAQQQFAAACRPPASPPDSGSLPEQVQQVCAQHPLADAECKAQLLQGAEEAQGGHAKQLQERRSTWQAFLAASSAACGIDSPSGSGTAQGWPADEHLVFLHSRQACLAPGGGGRAALVRQLAALLPGRTQQQVQSHEQWHKEASRLQGAVQQLEARWRQECAAFVAAAGALLGESAAGYLAGADAALRQLEAAVACLRSAGDLQQLQAAQEEQAAVESVELQKAAAAAVAQQWVQKKELEERRACMKQLLAAHCQRQAEQAAAAHAAQQAAAAEAAAAAAAAAAVGRQRAEYRKQQAATRAALRQQEVARRQREAQRRGEALEQLRRQVAPEVRRDAGRATGATHSSGASADKPQRLFAEARGFTTDQLLRDQRFKVGGRRGVAANKKGRPSFVPKAAQL